MSTQWEDQIREQLAKAMSAPIFTGVPMEGLTDEDAEAQNVDKFPALMVEATTEYDWAELPNYLKDIFRNAAREFNHWADNEHSPLVGELANEIEAAP